MKKFLVGVANIYYYNTNSQLVFQSKTMLDTAIEVSTDSTNINGGQGNALQYIYFHTPEMSLTLTETQFNLGMLGSNVGSDLNIGTNVWVDEEVTLGAGGAGTVVGTPLVTPDESTIIYGWVTNAEGDTVRVEFTGQGFTLPGGAEGDVVCVRFYENNTAAKSIDINANFVPAVGRLVMEAQLASSNSGKVQDSSIIGKVQFEINRAQLSGAQSIEMSSSGVSQTPLTAMALADDNRISGCTGAGVYGKITEVIDGANWYDTVFALAATNADIDLEVSETEKINLFAVPRQGNSFMPPYEDITFATGDAGVATVDADGIVTAVGAGETIISATITEKDSVEVNIEVTVTV